MKIRFYNANILSFDESSGFMFGEVCVNDNKIEYVGENRTLNIKYDEEIDVKGNVLMPGFVNCHTHSAMTLLRGIKDDVSLEEWLFNNIIPIEERLIPNDVYFGTKLAILEYLSAGITSIDEMYYFPDEIVKACLDCNYRARIFVGNSGPSVRAKKNLFNKIKNQIVKTDLIKISTGVHSQYMSSEKDLDEVVNFASKNNLPVVAHLSETLKEVGDCLVKYKLTPVQLFEKFGFLDRKSTFYHCVHVDKDDADILSKYNANIVTCPSSNIKLASGIAPVHSFLNIGLNVAIGTDGAASNNSYDFFKEMFLVSTLSKVSIYDSSVVGAIEVLKMATKNGAKTLGYTDLGEIKKGYLADLILINIKKPHMQPVNNLVSNLVYSAKSSDVYMTMINGKILYHNGTYFIDDNADKIIEKCISISNKLKI